jgi:hypothetical protein
MIDFTSLISRRSALAVGASGLSIGLIGLSGLRPLPAQNPAQGFTFALIGDLGYVPSEEPWLQNVLTELSKDTALSFVVHVGDLSSHVMAARMKYRRGDLRSSTRFLIH